MVAKVTIALVGTCDTKLQELLRLRQLILRAGADSVLLIDTGRHPASHDLVDVSRSRTPAFASRRGAEIEAADRSGCLRIMAEETTAWVRGLHAGGGIHGIISAGGSGGTSVAAPVMREGLPIGFPKLLISTIASGDVGPLVGESDVTMMYSVVDIAGSNTLLERIFSNAAGAIVGMARAWAATTSSSPEKPSRKKKVGITMFGVTTPCVNMARERLESKYGYECYVFHATGHGGKAMERLVEQAHELDAVLDLTTTEICDELMGGNMSAGPTRLEAAAKAGIPCVVSVGATDMVNFGPREMVPPKYQEGRQLYEHNAVVTLMRTTPDECKAIGEFIADKLRRFAAEPSKIRVVLPLGGVSVIATPGAPFADPEADTAIFDAVTRGLEGSGIRVERRDEAINDEAFATHAADVLAEMMAS